jgi:hypothetical protein
MHPRGNDMSDRRGADPTLIHLQHTVDALDKRVTKLDEIPAQLAILNTNLQVLNNTLKIGALVFVTLFPVILTWNYFLGKESTTHGNVLAAQDRLKEK